MTTKLEKQVDAIVEAYLDGKPMQELCNGLSTEEKLLIVKTARDRYMLAPIIWPVFCHRIGIPKQELDNLINTKQ